MPESKAIVFGIPWKKLNKLSNVLPESKAIVFGIPWKKLNQIE